jgi:AcrR family transcriptional regulator
MESKHFPRSSPGPLPRSSDESASPSVESVPLDSKSSLIQSGISLFARSGFDGTTVKDIAEHARLNVSLISYHFGGKEGLYRTCLEQYGRERLDVASRLLKPAVSKEDFRVRIEMFIAEIFDCHSEQKELSQILHREVEMEVPVAEDVFKNTFLRVFQTLIDFLKDAQKSGILREEIDPYISAAIFFGTVLHFAKSDRIAEKFMGHSLKDPEYRKSVSEHLLLIWMEGAESRKSQKKKKTIRKASGAKGKS